MPFSQFLTLSLLRIVRFMVYLWLIQLGLDEVVY